MQRRGQCKFYAQGTCLKGESCEFVHDLKMIPAKKACLYYQRGSCAFGSRCKFEHSKSSWMESSASSSSCARGPTTSNHSPVCISSGGSAIGTAQNSSVNPVLPSTVKNPIASVDSATMTPQNPSFFAVLSDSSTPNISPVKPDIPNGQSVENGGNNRKICSLAADGICPLGESCSDIHGNLCATCGKYCLHPFKPEDREKHAKECKKKQALERSQEIECSVCLERVLSKTSAFERKFGLLSECDHPFCIACIKKWRSSSSSSGFEVNSAARACPICRKVSYYVIPSLIWHSSKEEKQEIINQYKAKLKSIDCRYFNFGNGSCRHGSSCFYKHEVKPGSSRRNRSSNANYRHNNRQHRGRWDDDDDLGFGDLVEMAVLDAMLGDFEEMFARSENTEEAMGDGAPGDEVPESLQFMNFLKELQKTQMRYSGDYDEEDLLEPWQREFMYAQLGYDDYDDFTNYHNYDYDSEDDE